MHRHELVVQYWHTQQASWHFMVILSLLRPNNTVQSFSGAKDSSLGRFLYLWSLHLVVNIANTMFKWIFLSLIFTPCCKYIHSKNNVKFLYERYIENNQASVYWQITQKQSKQCLYCMFMNKSAKNQFVLRVEIILNFNLTSSIIPEVGLPF